MLTCLSSRVPELNSSSGVKRWWLCLDVIYSLFMLFYFNFSHWIFWSLRPEESAIQRANHFKKVVFGFVQAWPKANDGAMKLLLIAPYCDGTDVGESQSTYRWVSGRANYHEVTL
jgi:hypothetical protein